MEQMARERYGLELNTGPFGIDSRPALVGAKFAEAQGVGEAFHDAVFRAYWQDAQNIEDLDVLAELATAVGLDRDQFLAALDDPHYQEAMLADVQQAFQFGLSGVPALVYVNNHSAGHAPTTARRLVEMYGKARESRA